MLTRRSSGARAGERRALRGAALAEGRAQMRVEPFGIVAAHMRRRAVEARGAQRARARRPLSGAGAKRAPSAQLAIASASSPRSRAQHAEQHRARRVGAHDPGGRRLAAQRVVDQPRDRRAVARAREAVREAPILEALRGRAAARLDIGEDLDGGGEACGGRHQMMKDANGEDDPHQQQHDRADARKH